MKNYKHKLGPHINLEEGELAVLDKVLELCSEYETATEVSDQVTQQLQEWSESGTEVEPRQIHGIIDTLIGDLNKISSGHRPANMVWQVNGGAFGLYHKEKA